MRSFVYLIKPIIQNIMSDETKTFEGSVTIKNPFRVNEENVNEEIVTFEISYNKKNFFLHNEEGVAVPLFAAFEMQPKKFVNGEEVEEEGTNFDGGYWVVTFSEEKGFQPVILDEFPEFDHD